MGNGDHTFDYSRNSWLGEEAQAVTAYRLHTADFDGDGDLGVVAPATGYDFNPFAGESNFMLWNSSGKLFKDAGTNTTHNYVGFTHQSDC